MQIHIAQRNPLAHQRTFVPDRRIQNINIFIEGEENDHSNSYCFARHIPSIITGFVGYFCFDVDSHSRVQQQSYTGAYLVFGAMATSFVIETVLCIRKICQARHQILVVEQGRPIEETDELLDIDSLYPDNDSVAEKLNERLTLLSERDDFSESQLTSFKNLQIKWRAFEEEFRSPISWEIVRAPTTVPQYPTHLYSYNELRDLIYFQNDNPLTNEPFECDVEDLEVDDKIQEQIEARLQEFQVEIRNLEENIVVMEI